MKKLGFIIVAVTVLSGRGAYAQTPVAPDTAQWSVVKLVQVGREAMVAGDRAQARTLAEAAVSRDSGYAEGWKLLGLLRVQAGETNAAVQAFRTALLIAPRDPVINREFAWLIWNEDREKALSSLDMLVKANLGDRDAIIKRVLTQLAETGNEAKALELYKRWSPGFSLSELGIALYQSGRRVASVPFLDAAWAANDNRAGVALYLAAVESRRGKWTRVNACLKLVLDQAPATMTDEQSDLLWDCVLTMKADPALADVWKKLAARYPVELEKKIALADRFEKAAATARRRSDTGTASFLLRQALTLDPDRISWADWALAEERVATAADMKASLSDLLPRAIKPAVRDGMAARLAHYQGDLEAAVPGYRKSLAAQPDQLALRLFLVRDLLTQGKAEDARRELAVIGAPAKDGAAGRSQKELAEFWLEAGDVAKAVELDRTILTQKSKALLAENDIESAYTLAALAITNDAGNAEAWLQYGVVQGRRQQYAASRAALEQSITLKAGRGNVYQELGWTLWAMGDKAGASAAWEKALELGVPDRERFVRQVVGRMAEEGQKELALDRHAQWLPGSTPFSTGLDFYKAGRAKAAEPFLEKAWAAGENRAVTGFYLGSVRALNGVVAGTPQCFAEYIASCVATAAPADLAIVTDALRVCSGIPGSVEALDSLSAALVGRPDQLAKVTDLYFAYARAETERANLAAGLSLYEKALSRDPNRLVWMSAWNLSQRLNESARGMRLLKQLDEQATVPAVRSGVAGKLAELKGEYLAAIKLYEESVAAAPDQVDIHKDLFDCCIKLADFERARRETEWMAARVDEGTAPLRDTLATMWTELGEDEKALAIWQYMNLSMPDVPYYATEMAMAQYRLGKGEAAVDTLNKILKRSPTTLAYESLAQILAALGRPEESVKAAQAGLKLGQSAQLRRGLAENLETVDAGRGAKAAVVAAQDAVSDDPGSFAQELLLSRALVANGRAAEAKERHLKLLSRNAQLAPSLIMLRDYELVVKRPRQALPYAERLAMARPWDDMAVRRYAMTLAEADGFSRATRVLEPLAERNENTVTALLWYNDITVYDYPGRNTAAQIAAHMVCLASNGFRFVTEMPLTNRTEKTVMLFLVQPDRAVVEAVDVELRKQNAKAVLVLDPRCLKVAFPRKPSPQMLAELRKSGRWEIALTVADREPAVVRADGVKGNPLTHRILVKGEQESLEAMSKRVSAVMAETAAAGGAGKGKLFVYPRGDYGQYSLDTDAAVMAALSNAVGTSFATAICRDDNGFISGTLDPLRLPAKMVPPTWTAVDLEKHIVQGNPVVRTRLELAKLLYWHGQTEAASYWFKKAREAGANPFEVSYNEAANAAIAGDLAQALEKSRDAVRLAPVGDDRAALLLEKATHMRRPSAEVEGMTWWDNEDRRYWEAGVSAEGPVKDWLRWEAGLKRHKWETQGVGHQLGTSADLGFLAYIAPEVWLEAGMQEWAMDTLPNETGWRASLHLPNPLLRGYVNVISRMEMMETVEALLAGITSHREGVETYSRVLGFWDCFADLSLTQRSDGNDTWWGNMRLIRRLKETPYLGVGYAGRFADSTTEVPEYWSPSELQQHQAYAAIQATGVKWGAQLSGQAGFAKEEDTDWSYVVGGKVTGIYRFTPRLNVGGDVQYQEGPIYNRATVEGYLKFKW